MHRVKPEVNASTANIKGTISPCLFDKNYSRWMLFIEASGEFKSIFSSTSFTPGEALRRVERGHLFPKLCPKGGPQSQGAFTPESLNQSSCLDTFCVRLLAHLILLTEDANQDLQVVFSCLLSRSISETWWRFSKLLACPRFALTLLLL